MQDTFIKRTYTQGTTPLEKLSRLSGELGGPSIYIKRDDLTGLAAGGNKTRKLEYLMAKALENQADTIITCGALQSNHCRLTLSAALKENLNCILVLEEPEKGSYQKQANGNNLLYQLMSPECLHIVPPGTDMELEMELVAETLKKQGRESYIIPGGGSSPIGCLGYVSCAKELLIQTEEMGFEPDGIVVTSGSGGTQAGMITGLSCLSRNIPVYGIQISNRLTSLEQSEKIAQLSKDTAALLGLTTELPAPICLNGYIGPGYTWPSPDTVETIKLLLKTEGILLDPVYTGKAMNGLLDLAATGVFSPGQNIVFLHTGGAPGLFAYANRLL